MGDNEMSDDDVDEAAAAMANEIATQIRAALSEHTDSFERELLAALLSASRGLDAEAVALGDADEVAARAESLRAQLAQLGDPSVLALKRRMMTRAAEHLRHAAATSG